MDLEQMFSYFLKDPDPKTREWPMMVSWYPILFITFGYLYFIYIAGPRYMRDRPPYKLKTFILVYDIIQILANAWIVKEHIRGGWFTKCGFKMASKPDFDSPYALVLLNTQWYVVQLKIIDYIETCVFVLRKKPKQVSNLHVYHHVSTVILYWIGLRYYPDIRTSFISIANCSTHVIMYTYYLCAARGPKIQQIVALIKPYITLVQMVQLLAILAYLIQSVHPSHELPYGPKFNFLACTNISIYLLLFYNFYRKTYVKKQTSKQKC